MARRTRSRQLFEASLACGTRTLRLVALAYARAPWFRLLREPPRAGMVALSRVHGIDVSAVPVRAEACRGAIRLHRGLLEERSPLFRALNRLANPVFDALLLRIVGAEAVREAKEHAQAATSAPPPA